MIFLKKTFKKADVILIAVLVVAAVATLLAFTLFADDGGTVIVKKNDEVVYEGKLSENDEVALYSNTLIIEDGYAYMRYADCKNQICVNTGKISKKGETIVCLPNKVTVEIK